MGLILKSCDMLKVLCSFTPGSKVDPRHCHGKESESFSSLYLIISFFFPSPTKRLSFTRGTKLNSK